MKTKLFLSGIALAFLLLASCGNVFIAGLLPEKPGNTVATNNRNTGGGGTGGNENGNNTGSGRGPIISISSIPAGRVEMKAVYVDNQKQDMAMNGSGDFTLAGQPQNEIIHHIEVTEYDSHDVEINGTPRKWFIGRPAVDMVPLQISMGAGTEWDVEFRPADSSGHIPIGTVAELQLINKDDGSNLSGDYLQEADIDLLGGVTGTFDSSLEKLDWTPIGKDANGVLIGGFTGVFDGGGNKLENLLITGTHPSALTRNNGLFSQVGDGSSSGAEVKKVKLWGSVTIGSNPGMSIDNTGSIAGYEIGRAHV
jgi:hypothetical protein